MTKRKPTITKKRIHVSPATVCSLLFAAKHKDRIADLLIKAYQQVPLSIKPRPPIALRTSTVSLTAKGLGDCVILTDLPRAGVMENRYVKVWAGTPVFNELMKFCPQYHDQPECPPEGIWMFDALRLINEYDCGNGHITQQLRRAMGLHVNARPSGSLQVNVPRRRNRVLLHFEPASNSVAIQKRLHPRPRDLYEQNKSIIEDFIAVHPELEFIEVGHNPRHFFGATYFATSRLSDLLEVIQSCSWFIGIMSGPLNVATALGLKCVVIANIPAAERLVLPTLRRTYSVEEEWQYPQNVHLHEDGETALVPRLSLASLEAAFAGDVYPFWSDRWLDLINEEPYA